jgi:hypothetical protein
MKAKAKVEQEIKSSKKKVWNIVGPFEKIGSWFNGIEKTEMKTSSNGNSIRTLTLENGAVLSDELIGEEEFAYTYKIIEGELPFKDYIGTIGVKDSTNGVSLYYEASIDVSEKNKDDSISFLENLYARAFKKIQSLLEN